MEEKISGNKGKITTMKVYRETKERLEHFKEHRKESYDEVIKKMLYLINVFAKSQSAGMKVLKNISRARKRKDIFEKRNEILIKKERENEGNRQEIK